MPRILLYTTLLILAASSAIAVEVRLKSEALCSGAIVRLKDVAEIISANGDGGAALAELQLFPVPSAGKVRNVRRGEIRELLALSGVDLSAVTLSGAEKLVVRRVETRVVSIAPAAVIPTALITPSTKMPRSGERVGVELAPVAVRDLERGTILRASDLELRPLANQPGNAAAPLKVADLVGMQLLRPLPAGQQVLRELAQSPRLVRRNDKVTIKAVAAGVVVSAEGQALEEGSQGDNVLVLDAVTKEKLVARVVGYQVVEVLGTGVKKVR